MYLKKLLTTDEKIQSGLSVGYFNIVKKIPRVQTLSLVLLFLISLVIQGSMGPLNLRSIAVDPM